MLKSHSLSFKRFTRASSEMPAPAGVDRITQVSEPRAERLSVAALRRVVMKRVWGGKGCGAPCDFCRVLVTSSDVEYELEAELDGQPVTLHFHPRCHEAWRAERLSGELPAPAAQERRERRHD
jgi:hypothetical protein